MTCKCLVVGQPVVAGRCATCDNYCATPHPDPLRANLPGLLSPADWQEIQAASRSPNVRRDAIKSLYEIAEELRSYKPDHGNLHAAWAVQLSKALKKLEVVP